MVRRRAQGTLEAEVLAVMWAADDAMTPAEVRAAMGTDLAYTTIMTIQTRLLDKGLVERERRGRAFAYRPTVTEAELAARRMSQALIAASDREAVLGRFVDELSVKEAQALRRVLDEMSPPSP